MAISIENEGAFKPKSLKEARVVQTSGIGNFSIVNFSHLFVPTPEEEPRHRLKYHRIALEFRKAKR